MSDIHFGFNCQHFRPNDNRCEIAIERLKEPKYHYLHVKKWVTIEKAAEALGVKLDAVKKMIEAGELKTRPKSQVCIDQAWDYEQCPLHDTGGICGDYEPCLGKRFDCVVEWRECQKENRPDHFKTNRGNVIRKARR